MLVWDASTVGQPEGPKAIIARYLSLGNVGLVFLVELVCVYSPKGGST